MTTPRLTPRTTAETTPIAKSNKTNQGKKQPQINQFTTQPVKYFRESQAHNKRETTNNKTPTKTRDKNTTETTEDAKNRGIMTEVEVKDLQSAQESQSSGKVQSESELLRC